MSTWSSPSGSTTPHGTLASTWPCWRISNSQNSKTKTKMIKLEKIRKKTKKNSELEAKHTKKALFSIN
jgi:hypothetical protein